MTDRFDPPSVIREARRLYVDRLASELPPLFDGLQRALVAIVEKTTEFGQLQRRRELQQELGKRGPVWVTLLGQRLRDAGDGTTARSTLPQAPSSASSTMGSLSELTLLDDETLQRGIQLSRTAQAIRDRAVWEFTDLRARVSSGSGIGDLGEHDVFQSAVVAEAALGAWGDARLTSTGWSAIEEPMLKALAGWVFDAYHETNQWLVKQGIQPQIDLRSLIKRTPGHAASEAGGAAGGAPAAGTSPPGGSSSGGYWVDPRFASFPSSPSQHGEMMVSMSAAGGADGMPVGVWVRGTPLSAATASSRAPMITVPGAAGVQTVFRSQAPAMRVWLERHVPGVVFDGPPAELPPGLAVAIDGAQRSVAARLEPQGTVFRQEAPAPREALEELRRQQEAIKKAASTPVERATVEIVALMFQSILTEDRIPAAIRVWFARLQMPVLRVAIAEPDFFASSDHPARRLIDRLGSCAMGFDDAAATVGTGLEAEVKRIVQVVEAFPDTGRRVFQTVLTEFEKFLEDYLKSRNEQSKQAVTIAQQVEQRETLAIQYTIELRKMLDAVRVQEGVRHFLFQTWADVMATAAVRHGAQGDEARQMKRIAGELVWAASAKTTREERAEVIRRLPPLLKALRAGMSSVGVVGARQDEALGQVNKSLTTAFSSRTSGPAIDAGELEALKQRLEELEYVLPADEIEFDDSYVLDLADDESDALEVVADGGAAPSPAMLERAGALSLGEWFRLDYRGRVDPVQLAWHGMKRQLALFVSASGRCVLFPKRRLASFMEAGLLLPAQVEPLTTMAARRAMAKIDADPERIAAA